MPPATLQLVDCDTCSAYDVPLAERLRIAGIAVPPGARPVDVARQNAGVLGRSDAAAGTMVRLFCKRADGADQVVYLRDAPPYMYVQAPPEFSEAGHGPAFGEFIEQLVPGARVVSIELVRDRRQYMGYATACTPMLRITLRDPRHIGRLRSEWLGRRGDLPPLELMGMRFPRRVWEADVQYHMRVCVDRKLPPFSWMEVPDASGSAHNGATHTVLAANLVRALGTTGEYSRISPHVRVVAFDIECEALTPGTFPSASRDPIISIGNVVYTGVDTSQVADAVVFISLPPEQAAAPVAACPCCCCRDRAATGAGMALDNEDYIVHCKCAGCAAALATPAPVDRLAASVARHSERTGLDADRFRVEVLPDERAMLEAWAAHVREVWRPHVLIGYNSALFDMPYVHERAQQLNCLADVGRLSPWDTAAVMQLKKNNINTRAHGRKDDYVTVIPGVLHIDLFCIVTKEARCRDGTKPRSYKLGDIAAEFLSPEPDTVPSDGEETDEDEWGLDDEPAATPSEDVRTEAAGVLDDATMRIVTKRDLHHTQIAPHYHGTPEQRWTLCDYNEWDARLVGMLNCKLKLLQNLIGMARVTYVGLTALVHGGQQIKVHMQMLALAAELGFAIPTRWREPREDEVAAANAVDVDPDEPDGEADPRYEHVVVAGQTRLQVAPPVSTGVPAQLNANGKRVEPDAAAEAQMLAGGGAVQLGTEFARVKRLRRKVATRAREKAYEGAVVIEPKRGFYPLPVETLDFSSLYPSIMRTHNLSHDTLVLEAVRCAHGHDMLNSAEALRCCVHATPNGDRFVNWDVHKGLLVVLLERLLAERSVAKRAMGAAKASGDAAEEAVQDGRQLALKISANSVYGFTGATVGKLPCLEISAGVTAYGREMITGISALVAEVFARKNALIANQQEETEVVYGDTDSIFVKFGVPTIAEAEACGHRAARLINAYFGLRYMTPAQLADAAAAAAPLFPDEAVAPDALLALLKRRPDEMAALINARHKCPISIVREKDLKNLILITKKRYAAELWLNTRAYDHIHQSGLESVRRDNSLFTNELVREVIRILTRRGNVQRAVRYARKQVRALARGRIPFDKLVVSRAYNKRISEYADANKGAAAVGRQEVDAGDASDAMRYTGAQPHLIVVQKRLDRRDEPFKMGERVPYVLVMPQGQDALAVRKRKLTQSDIVEDPEYAKRHHLLPHADYYIRHQAEKPLTRIFDTVLGDGATRRLVLTPDVVSVTTARVRDDERFFGAFKRAAEADVAAETPDDSSDTQRSKAPRTDYAAQDTSQDNGGLPLMDEIARRSERELAPPPTQTLTDAAATQQRMDTWQRDKRVRQATVDAFFSKK